VVEHLMCASPAYLAARGVPAHPRDLARHDCLHLGEDERDRHWRFERPGKGAADAVTVKVRGRCVANHGEVRCEAAVAGLGIATLPDFTATSALANGSLVRVRVDWRHTTAYSGTAAVSTQPLPARARAGVNRSRRGALSARRKEPQHPEPRGRDPRHRGGRVLPTVQGAHRLLHPGLDVAAEHQDVDRVDEFPSRDDHGKFLGGQDAEKG
jgi:hypothetical protein